MKFNFFTRTQGRPVAPSSQLCAVLRYLASQINSAYIVGAEECDSTLYNDAVRRIPANIFEQKFTVFAEMSTSLIQATHVHMWHRCIDDGANNTFKNQAAKNVGASNNFLSSAKCRDKEAGNSFESGSLDQFFIGTGLIPELIKITPQKNILSILAGCREIIFQFEPIVMFRTSDMVGQNFDNIYEMIGETNYHFIDVDTNKIIEQLNERKNPDSYVLGLTKPVLSRLILFGTGRDIITEMAQNPKQHSPRPSYTSVAEMLQELPKENQ